MLMQMALSSHCLRIGEVNLESEILTLWREHFSKIASHRKCDIDSHQEIFERNS